MSARVRTAPATTDQADSKNDISISLGFAVVDHEFGLHVKYEENNIIHRTSMENTKVNNMDLDFISLALFTQSTESRYFSRGFFCCASDERNNFSLSK